MRLKLNDKIGLKKDNQIIYKKLETWINDDPQLVYNHIYRPDLTKLDSIAVTKDVITLLKEKLNK